MDKYYKLAEFIKAGGLKAIEYAQKGYKGCDAETFLGIVPTDAQPERITIKDDSGYRAMILGDIRGNVSYNTRERADLYHKGYVYLYSENATYRKDGTKRYRQECFPSVERLYKQLKALKNANYKSEGTSLFYMIRLNDSQEFDTTKKYLSEVVERFANILWNDKRSVSEIIFMAERKMI